MTRTNEHYVFYFKICYTQRSFYLYFLPETTIKDFIKYITDYINDVEYQVKNIEIVEVGQSGDEQAPKINYHNDYTLRDVYGHKWRNTAFYIRIIPNL